MQVLGENDEADEPKSIDGVITDVKLMYSGTNDIIDPSEPIEQNSNIKLAYKWKIPDDKDIKGGDFSVIHLPDIFDIYNPVTGILPVEAGNSAGTFTLDMDGKLTITYSEFVEEAFGVEGFINLETVFNKDKLPDDNPGIIIFPIGDSASVDLRVKFKPDNVSGPIEKSGEANKTINATEIEWTIDVNKTLEKVDNAVIIDTFDKDQLEIKDGTFKVYKLSVNLNGDAVIDGDSIFESSKLDKTLENGFEYGLGNIEGAYRIVYTTEILDNSKTSFKNTASFNGGSSPSSVETPRGNMIEKTVEANKAYNADKLTWTIYVNKSLANISNGELKDIYGLGLKLDETTIKVYELTLNDDGSEGGLTEYADYTFSHHDNDNKFEIKFNSTIDKAYKVVYETDLIDIEQKTFNNKANFNGSETEKPITIKIGENLKKSGAPSIGYNDEKFINWTIDVNGRELDIKGLTLTDKMGAGHELVPGSIRIYKMTYNDDGSQDSKEDVTSEFIKKEDSDKKGFNILLNDITNAYKIEYRTKITDRGAEVTYTNEATLTGSGEGIGTGDKPTTVNGSVTVNIQNTFVKTKGGIDYSDNTMSWKITINPIKEGIKDLQIIDTFPQKGLTMLEDSLIVKKGNETLYKDSHYTLEEKGREGFVLKFKDDLINHEVNNAVYEITYKTKFDRATHSDYKENELLGELEYENKADFTWYNDGETSDNASQKIKKIAGNNGEKSGKLLSRESKEIEWTVDFNYLSESLGEINFQDIITEGQELVTDYLEIYNYRVTSDGKIVDVNKAYENEYTIKTQDKSKLEITFNDVKKPYRVVFKTKIVKSIADATYKNTADVGGTIYTGSTGYSDSDVFVQKSGKQDGGKINWEININKSLSRVSNAKLVDTSTGGHIVDGESFEVYETNNASNILEEGKDYELSIEDEIWNDEGKSQKFTLEFKNTISKMYTIKYETIIEVAEDKETLSNTVKFTGDGVDQETKPEDGNVVVKMTTGEGGAMGNFGKLTIKKIDGNTEEGIEGVEFAIFNSRGGKIKQTNTDNQGKIFIPNLIKGDYTLKEIKTVDGYQDFKDIINVSINKLDNIETIKNYRLGKLEITKLNGNDTSIKLEGAEFLVKSSDGTIIDTITTNGDGKANLGGLQFGEYHIIETKVPEGYKLDNTVYTIEVTEESVSETIKLEVKNYASISLQILKVEKDNDDKVLSGAVFEVKDSKGNKVGNITTGFDGKGTLDNLGLGMYIIKETKAPYSYILDNTQHTVNISSEDIDGEVIIKKIKIINSKKPITPTKPIDPPTRPDRPDRPDPVDPDPVDPTDPPTTDPVLPVDPTDPEPTDPTVPTEPVDPPVDPEEPTNPPTRIEEETPPDTPVIIDVEIPEGSIVVEEPKNGKVTFENGKPVYTPNPGFTGKDKFTIKIINEDGEEEIIEIEIDIPEAAPMPVPEEENEEDKLAKTGAVDDMVFYIGGLLLILAGLFLRRRKTVK